MENPNFVNQFIPGIIASFIGGYLLALFGILHKWLPFMKFKNTGVVKVFKNQKDATNSIEKEIENSKIVYLLAIKGDTFSNPDNPLSNVLSNAKIEQRYLISSLNNKYLIKRGEELDVDMIKSVDLSVDNFYKAKKHNNNIQLKRHDEVVRFRIILLTNYLFLSFQEDGIPGKESHILKICKNSSMYKTFSSLFEDLWDKY